MQPLACPPSIRYIESQSHGRLLIRGDSEGAVMVWNIPEVTDAQLAVVQTQDFSKPPG